MWILDRLEIALQRADLMFGSIAEDGSLGYMSNFFDGLGMPRTQMPWTCGRYGVRCSYYYSCNYCSGKNKLK